LESIVVENIRVCYLCQSNKTYKKCWYKYNSGYICLNCYQQNRYRINPVLKILQSKIYQQNNREKQNSYVRKSYLKNRDIRNERLSGNHNIHRKRYRILLLELLGNKCIRCGFSDSRALQFDHINDDGYLDRKLLKNAQGILLYYYKHQEEAKNKLQIMCANCNWIKRFEINKHNQYNR